MTTDAHGRAVSLSGPVNFRDIGGYPTRGGGRVRTGVLYRSDGLWDLSAGDVAHLTGERGLRTVVDLRGPDERRRFGEHPLEAAGLTYHNVAFMDDALRPDVRIGETTGDGAVFTLADLYLFFVRRATHRVAQALRVLGDASSHPAVFHCTAGKDRTGIVAALLLTLAGVDEETVTADYALTTPTMLRWVERTRAWYAAQGHPVPEFSAHVLSAEASTMAAVLAAVRTEHGSVEAWASAVGVDVARLRESLVE